MESSNIAALQIGATVLLNLAFAGLVGILLSGMCLRSQRSDWSTSLVRPLAISWAFLAPLAVLGSIAALWLEAASMAEVPISEAWPAVRAFLETTHYGRIWLAGAVVLLIGVLVNSKLTEGRLPTVWAQRITGISLALFALSRTLVSHAVVNGDVSWAVAVDWLHLILICVWVGEVFVSGLIVLRKPIFGDSQDRQAAVYYINVLSTSATIALIGIVLTGILNAVRGIGNVENLLGNQYSNVLITKLVFVVIAIGLGGFNRFMVMPDFLTGLTEAGPVPDQPQRKFLLVLMVEAAVLTGALVAAAILSGTAPPTAS